ncbi:MAG TPA: zf-HC2 domain-containing protein, partial [bacterium]|nr:zf-HC2 domain-containing protein [bacterium]
MTARCPDPAIHERLAAYELGLLPDDERREVEAHLLRCPLCAEELWATAPFASAATEAPGEVLAELPRPAPPAVADRLRSWWERRARVLVPAAALAGLTVMMLYEMTPPGTAS